MDSLLTLSVMRGARQVASLADLRRLNGARGETIVLVGSLVAGDGGGGLYRWDTTSTTGDDGNQIVVPVNPRGRWVFVPMSGAATSGALSRLVFPAGVDEDDAPQLLAALVATAYAGKVVMAAGAWRIDTK